MVKDLEKNKLLFQQDLDLLIKEGNLGFYKSCEITTIFLFDRETKTAMNFYTIGVFEELEIGITETTEHLTEKPIDINKRYSLGIIRYRRTIEDINKKINLLLEENKWTYKKKHLEIGDLKALPKQFIPSSLTESVPVNSVLKNNFNNGSYVLEFFDEEKQLLNEVLESDKHLAQVCKEIGKVLPIDLLFISDRIGNIVFQFPSNLLAVDVSSLNSWEGLETKILWHPLTKEFDDIIIQAKGDFDNSIMGIDQVDFSKDITQVLNTGSSGYMNDIIIYNKRQRLILSYLSLSFMKDLQISGFVSIEHQEKRTIKLLDDEEEIPIVYKANQKKPKKIDCDYWISNRIYENTKRNLGKNLIFVQYGKGINEREEALRDLRSLINRYGEDGIYLWDPYLSPEDILTTLYYCKIASVPMRAISSNATQNREETYDSWVKRQKEYFEKSSNHLGINLELRSQHNHHGWKFHDRFIIFPSDEGKPKAWSLGTSVNSLGKTHHILQEVSNAQMILDAFMELWEELAAPECRVWGSKE